MATHSSVLAWRVPGTGEPGLWGRTESDTTEVTWQAVFSHVQLFATWRIFSNAKEKFVLRSLVYFRNWLLLYKVFHF